MRAQKIPLNSRELNTLVEEVDKGGNRKRIEDKLHKKRQTRPSLYPIKLIGLTIEAYQEKRTQQLLLKIKHLRLENMLLLEC